MEETKNPKCNRCKCYWKPDETDIKSSGLYAKSCKKCRAYQTELRNKNKCPHNKEKSVCRECGGGSFCIHNKIKSKCRECDGSSFCIHNKEKSKCRECGGGSICPHNKIKSKCRECGGSSFCIHNKEKSKCRECGGSSICPHNKIKSICRECGGGSICEHNKEKSKCRECGGSSICEHNKQKSSCRECGGSSFCIHNKQKSYCRECGGSSICEHNKIKSICRECDGSSFCIHNKRKRACKECNYKLYLVNLLRGALYRCIKSSNLDKTKPSIDYLGCSIEYFIEYFKKKMDIFNQFSEIEMTFDNIHIDHIKPVNSFNLDDVEEFLSCCNYTNLQPLLADVNLSKNCKWSDEDDVFWTDNIKDKEYYDIYLPK